MSDEDEIWKSSLLFTASSSYLMHLNILIDVSRANEWRQKERKTKKRVFLFMEICFDAYIATGVWVGTAHLWIVYSSNKNRTGFCLLLYFFGRRPTSASKTTESCFVMDSIFSFVSLSLLKAHVNRFVSRRDHDQTSCSLGSSRVFRERFISTLRYECKHTESRTFKAWHFSPWSSARRNNVKSLHDVS